MEPYKTIFTTNNGLKCRIELWREDDPDYDFDDLLLSIILKTYSASGVYGLAYMYAVEFSSKGLTEAVYEVIAREKMFEKSHAHLMSIIEVR